MAVLCRVGLLKTIINNNAVCTNILPVTFKRNIYGKATRATLKEPLRGKPFPYMERKFNFLDNFRENTLERLNANAKVVVVEGPIAAGKSAIAKEIAEEFDMKHFPEANMDRLYINSYGHDLRDLDPQLPDTCKSYDHKNFCLDPFHPTAASYQIITYRLRYSQYLDALTHLMNTGQGVVLERSPYSDHVFIDAMHQCKFIDSPSKSVYYDIRKNTISELLKPHLVIYLDTPIESIKKRIAARNLPYEKNSKALTDEYLKAIEKFYKTKYLKDISTHAELLVYDWTEPGDTEIVLEDIERIDFDNYEMHTPKMDDWNFVDDSEATDVRREYTNEKMRVMSHFLVPRYDVPNMIIPSDDAFQRDLVINSSSGYKYVSGFNEDCGDKGVLFKIKDSHRPKDSDL